MRIVKNNKRISVLGLIKFLAAIAIVYFHVFPEGHWSHLWLLVEMFFFITGYFTFKHFRKKENRGKTAEQKSKNAISYTAKKFLPLIPFVLVAISIKYTALILRNDGTSLPSILKILPLDILLLNSQTSELNWPLWYLSAMLIVFPLFCYMCQTKQKHTLYIILFTSVIAYYFNFFNGATDYLGCLIRAFFGMSTGILIYAFSREIRKHRKLKKESIIPFMITLLCMLVSILCLYPSNENNGYSIYGTLYMIFTVIWMSILLSGRTILSRISSPFLNYLEKLSMVIYMVHVPIFYILCLPILPFTLSKGQLLIVTIMLSITLGVLLSKLVAKISAKARGSTA